MSDVSTRWCAGPLSVIFTQRFLDSTVDVGGFRCRSLDCTIPHTELYLLLFLELQRTYSSLCFIDMIIYEYARTCLLGFPPPGVCMILANGALSLFGGSQKDKRSLVLAKKFTSRVKALLFFCTDQKTKRLLKLQPATTPGPVGSGAIV